ncbi:MAG TPA: carboxylesterase family protein [Burkholderiaceae bacterium]|nr:carboxylesterase family protein [Burkholderiaceae bacterium]
MTRDPNSFFKASTLSRRGFLLSSAAAAATLVGCGGGDDDSVVSTSSGSFQGQTSEGVTSYLGIPYAQPPVGALRFRAPQPYQPRSDVVKASSFGAASIQNLGGGVRWIYPPQDNQGEDCLSLNVWAPQGASKLPVVVWLHGGGFRTGATSMPFMNGQHLAARGVVMVTANYRLGAMGLISHPDLTDPGNGTSANWQLQDMGAALAWVKQNIAAFGGDPDNVCLMGQSGGAKHAAILAQNPAYRSLFHKAVLLSPPSVQLPVAMTMQDAAAYTELLAARLGTTVRGLRDVPALALHNAEVALNALPLPASITTGKGFKLAPLIDGKTYLADWTRGAWPADKPVIITYTLDEGAFFLDLYDPVSKTMLTPPLPATTAALTGAVLSQVGGSATAATSVINAYTQAAQQEGRSTAPGDLWVDIFGDRLLRNYGTRYAATIASAGAQVRYGTFMEPVPAPGRGVPHCAELPLVFGTYALDYYKDKLGTNEVQGKLFNEMASALTSFARNSDAKFASGQAWPVYKPGTATSARIGEGGSSGVTLGPIPKLAQMAAWDGVLGY